jgi:hypothetical protein
VGLVVRRGGLADAVTRCVVGRAVVRAVVGVGAVVAVVGLRALLVMLVLEPAPVGAAVAAGRLEQPVSSSAAAVSSTAGAAAYLRCAVLIARSAGSRAWTTTRPSAFPGR